MQALLYKNMIAGVGLDSTEIGFPNELFKDVFTRAAAEGFSLVAHAGAQRQQVDLLTFELLCAVCRHHGGAHKCLNPAAWCSSYLISISDKSSRMLATKLENK